MPWDSRARPTSARRARVAARARAGALAAAVPATILSRPRRSWRSRNLLGLAIDTVSGPSGLASFLRTQQLGAPFSGQSLPLDIGETDGIPEYLRRAVIRRDGRCQFPGCWKPPAACEPHHVKPRSEGGETSLWNLKLFCWTHHHVFIHRDGWQILVHTDGTVTARAPWGVVLHSNDTVAA